MFYSVSSPSMSFTVSDVLPCWIVALFPVSIAWITAPNAANANNSPVAARTLPSIKANGGIKKEIIISNTDIPPKNQKYKLFLK